MNEASSGRLQLLLDWAAMRLQRERVPNVYDNAVFSIAQALHKETLHPESAQQALDLLDDLVAVDMAHASDQRFVPLRERLQAVGGRRSLPPLGYLLGQGVNAPPTWKGRNFYKSVWDLALYNELLWELQPASIIELGSGDGASADWFATMSAALGIETEVVSFDAQPPVTDARAHFVRAVFPDDVGLVTAWTETLDHSRPWLIVEDMHVGIEVVLPAVAAALRPGDYLVVEDSASKQDVLWQLVDGAVDFVVDQNYTDRFGLNGTSAMNSVLKVR